MEGPENSIDIDSSRDYLNEMIGGLNSSTEGKEEQEVFHPIAVGRITGNEFKEAIVYIRQIGRENFSFLQLFQEKQLYESMKALGRGLPNGIERFGERFMELYEHIRSSGFDGAAKDLLVRWISTDAPDAGAFVEGVTQNLGMNGGMREGQESGVCMSGLGGKADDYFATQMSGGSSGGILLVYDGRKLRRLTEDEAKRDIQFSAGYGYLPKEGENYRSALLGAMEFIQ